MLDDDDLLEPEKDSSQEWRSEHKILGFIIGVVILVLLVALFGDKL